MFDSVKVEGENVSVGPLKHLGNSAQQLILYLKENSQTQLALHYVLDMQGANMLHVATQNMLGCPIRDEVSEDRWN